MKTKYLNYLLLFLLLIPLTSCTVPSIFGNKSKKIQAQATKVEKVDKQLNQLSDEKLKQISSYSYGVDYSLNKITNSIPLEVEVAKDLNQRILTISGNPLIDKIKEMEQMVNDLTSQLDTERKRGQLELNSKDNEILKIQSSYLELQAQKQKELDKYINLSKETALAADTYKSSLDQLEGNWGLNAIWYGVKKFLSRIFYVIIVLVVLYLVLRVFAASNPIVGSIFSVVEMMVAWCINLLKAIAPKAVNFSNLVIKETFDVHYETLKQIIDAIQNIKINKPEEKLSMDELCSTFKLTEEESKVVDDIKKELNYK
jgi:hypothetical protein